MKNDFIDMRGNGTRPECADFYNRLADLAIIAKRETIRCTAIVVCVAIICASVLAAAFRSMPPLMGACEPITYSYTDTAGTTTTTTSNGRQTTTTVTNAEGRIISMSVISGRARTGTEAQQRKAKQERKAAEREEKRRQREARRLEKQAAKLERRAEKLRQKADKLK